MKISQFIISAIGLLYTMGTEDLTALIIFGLLATVSWRRLMRELEESELEEEGWERAGQENRPDRRRH